MLATSSTCDPYPCQHGATCVKTADGYSSCLCPAGYTDASCETDINECLTATCHNGGTCLDAINGFKCVCPAGYTGSTCQISACLSSPCHTSATCVDKADGYECVCAAGYTGVNCHHDINDCSGLNPCRNGGTCLDRHMGYQCQCR